MHRRPIVVVVVVLAALAAGAVGWRLLGPTPVDQQDERLRGAGGVTLATTLWTPARGNERAPAVLLAHGLGDDRDGVRRMARGLAREGYVVRTWNARGVAPSTGSVGIAAADGEVADARALIDELAERTDVQQDGPGDPRVAIVGVSHGGGVALLAAARDERIDAAVPIFAWHDLRAALEPDAARTLTRGGPPGVLKLRWASELFAAGAGEGRDVADPCGNLDDELCDAWTASVAAGAFTPAARELLRARSPRVAAARLEVPTLIVHGQMDSLFGFEHALGLVELLEANRAPWRVEWLRGGHDLPLTERRRAHLQEAVLRWLDRHLRGTNRDAGPRLTVELGAGRGYAHAPTVPPPSRTLAVPLQPERRDDADRDGALRFATPAGGLPAEATTLPGLGDVTTLEQGFAAPERQRASFVTRPVTRGVELIGQPRVRLRLRGTRRDGIVFVRLVDIAPDGRRMIPRALVAPVRLRDVPPLDAADWRTVEVRLPWLAWRLAPGHRMAVEVASTDAGYVAPPAPATWAVAPAGRGLLQLPEVQEPRRTDDTFDAGPDWRDLLVIAAALVLGALAAGLVLAARVRRRDARVQEPQLREVPLRAERLAKRFRDGRLAVDHVSFTVQPGSIVGLVGPNGAGKTTTIRMLLGLVHPSDGMAWIYGQRVRPGVPNLARVGALVEGPGLVPHLTGRAHLRRFWSASGRPLEDAGIEDALAAVGLTKDADRVVRTWSQGMRQRLAIAQALLGRPDIVLLDEPANGLDPAQIAQLRELVRRIAADGRAVLLSSHLLDELERVCTHVVLMADGAVLEAGTLESVVGEHDGLEAAYLALVTEAGGGDA